MIIILLSIIVIIIILHIIDLYVNKVYNCSNVIYKRADYGPEFKKRYRRMSGMRR